MRILYSIGILVYSLLIRVLAPFHRKAKLMIDGRKTTFPKIDSRSKIIWIHAASLGEFEQGRPIIEAIKQNRPEYKILLTFFSPSGFEIRKNYEHADFVHYIPFDTIHNAKRFINHFKPEIAIFIKYEFWYNFLKVLNDSKINIIFVSAIFRPSQPFFKFYGSWMRKHLKLAEHFFVQDKNSAQLLEKIGINNVTIAGDTRYDRVAMVAKNPMQMPVLEEFSKNRSTILAGSTWEADEALLLDLMNSTSGKYNLIIAPHQIHESHIESIQKKFEAFSPVLISQALESGIEKNSNIVIINGMGYLMHLYQYCHIAFIGGGFGVGIHNILEAATFGKPVIFGPNYLKFKEAVDLIAEGGAFSISDGSDLMKNVEKLNSDGIFYEKTCLIVKHHVARNLGATTKILNFLFP